MGCTQSADAVVVTTESSSGGAKEANHETEKQKKSIPQHHPNATITTAAVTTTLENPQQQQNEIGNDPSLTYPSAPSSLLDNKTNNNKTSQNYNDDFTTDYIILKQVMVGMSALSNIYMVMKRPKPDADDEDHNIQNDKIEAENTPIPQPSPVSQRQNDDENDADNDKSTPRMDHALTTTATATTATNDHTVTINHAAAHNQNNDNHNKDNEIYVLQVIDMESVAPERRKSMRKEIISLQSIIHPNILRVHAVYDATRRDNTIATVTELCTGSHLQSSIPYPEPRAKKIIAQILDALQYMHQRKIFHNSLTTENILFQDDSQDAIIKITYAGVANLPSQSNSTSKHSNRFVIPEWNPSGKDIYSVGMIAYKLLSGGKEPPTDMDTQRVVPGTNLFLGRRWKLISISKNAKNFIERCLHSWDMKPQFTVEDALQHIWMTQEHVHRSDTSRSTDAVKEIVVAKWNDAGSSLTVSEPTVFHSTNETVPVVSLTAEQYTRDVKSSGANNGNATQFISNEDHDENNIPVFVNEPIIPDTVTDTDHMDEVAEDIVDGEIVDKPDESIVQEVVADTVPQEHDTENVSVPDNIANTYIATDDGVGSDTLPTSEEVMETTIDLKHEDIDAHNGVIEININNNTESIIPNKLDDSMPFDTSETDTPDEFVELRDAFQEVTTGSNSGDNAPVTMETLKERLRTKYTEEEVNSWFTGHEKYEDPKTLDYKVFLRKVKQNRKSIEIQRVDNAFKLIDKGKHGYVTVGNLRAVLGKDNTENIEQLIKDADTRRDGKISYENFERVVQNYLSTVT